MKIKPYLYAPPAYWQMSAQKRARLVNGCGTRGIIGALVPDTIYFLSIREACNIHDYMYLIGETPEDRDFADLVFLYNLIRIIQAGTRFKLLKLLRIRRARKYYNAVREFGGPAFWDDKNPPENMGTPVTKGWLQAV
jgi:hypothetical protein